MDLGKLAHYKLDKEECKWEKHTQVVIMHISSFFYTVVMSCNFEVTTVRWIGACMNVRRSGYFEVITCEMSRRIYAFFSIRLHCTKPLLLWSNNHEVNICMYECFSIYLCMLCIYSCFRIPLHCSKVLQLWSRHCWDETLLFGLATLK